jgi:hypothetical protein
MNEEGNMEYTIQVNVPTEGFVYIRVDDPFTDPQFRILSVLRLPENKELHSDNAWRYDNRISYEFMW